MLLYIHTTLESLSEPDGLPPSLPMELAPISPSSAACASSVARPLRDVGNALSSTPLNPLRFTLILLHLIFFTMTLLLSLDL